jgi:hypothetical protein
LLENVIYGLRILHVNVIYHNPGNFLLLGDLSSHPATVVVALSEQFCTLNKLALVAETEAQIVGFQLFGLIGLLSTRTPRWLNSLWFIGFGFIVLIGEVNLIKLGRRYEDVGA